MTYVRPQLQLFQEFQQAPTAVVQNLNAFVFGPNYGLFRFGVAAEKALIGLGAYDMSAPETYLWPNKPSGSLIDTAYAKLFVDNAWLKYAQVNNDAANPLVTVGANERNKLRAAPRIGTGEKVVVGPHFDAGGYFIGKVGLPEAYYWTPAANFTVGVGAGTLNYVTTEDLTGTTAIPANATTSGVIVQGPNGIAMDWDTSAPVKAPRVITVTDVGLISSFTLTLKPALRKTAIDSDIDLVTPYTIAHNNAALAATLVGAALTVDFQAGDSVNAIRAVIVAVPAIVAAYDVSAVTGVGTGVACTIKDQDATGITVATRLLPHAWRVKVFENDWVFQTANGVARTAALLRDVKLGDRVRLVVTPASTGVPVEILSKVVGFEPDYTLPALGTPAADSDNQTTQAGDDLSAGVAMVVAGTDNQRLFDGANTKLFSLSGADNYLFPDLARGVLSDTYTVTITTAGLKGVARATISNLSGTYYRANVKIESVGADDGQLYLGGNLFINLDKGGTDPDAIFQVGDVYTVSPAAPYTAVTNEAVSGTYGGSRNTTYLVEVLRGGKFTRATEVVVGLQTAAGTVLSTSLASWVGGDVDDEYVLECTSAGSLASAAFRLTSQRGDNQNSVAFAAVATPQPVGGVGLQLAFSVDVAFTVGDYWVVKVFAARPQVKVTDSAGIDQSVTVVATAGGAIALGLNGGYITFPSNVNGGLNLGERYTVAATASLPSAVQTLVLSDEVPVAVACGLQADGVTVNYTPDRFQAELYLFRQGVEIPSEQHDPLAVPGSYNWRAALANLTVNPDITLQDSEWVDGLGVMPYLELWYGDLYSQYRALLTDYSDTIYSIDDLAAVATELGTVDVDNPLAQAVYKALENSGQARVYFMAVPTNNVAGYNAVLDKASLIDTVYAFVPVSRDENILNAVIAHINSMSSATNKKWRITFFGRELPVRTDVLTQATNPLSVNWLATIINDPRIPGTHYRKVVLSTTDSLLANMRAGDEVRFKYTTDAWGNEAYATGVVGEVESDTVFYLVDSLPSSVPVASRIEAYHPLSVAEQATAVKNMATAYYNRRAYLAFPADLWNAGVLYTSEFAAAAIAGLCSSVVPQQGLTFTQLVGFDDLPTVYSTFNAAQLDEIASGGTFIVMQDMVGSQVYVRHQISTKASGGNLNETELSLVKNLDAISYFFAGQLTQYIGRYNVTPELLTAIRTQVENGLAYLGSLTSVGLLGPMILLEGTQVRTIQQHPTLKDRIVIILQVALPAPLNVIEMHIVV